jgi:acetyltransferase-like isoleucine patch superfamily enzyme
MILEIIYKRLESILYYLIKYPIYKLTLKKLGVHSRIINPLKIEGSNKIEIGNNVVIGKLSWLAAKNLTGQDTELKIGTGSRIGNFNHIYATSSIIIEDNVLTADKVYISDNRHEYESINKPILEQGIKQLNIVKIGSGSWIGENVCIFGASIGKNCIVGANSIVNKDIPDYCVAIGSPARIIKKYCFDKKTWIKIN